MAKDKKLVTHHLEKISWRVLDEYPGVINQTIRGRAGVYALYRRDKLYYVGLASNLKARLHAHLRDRHSHSWDRFSVYLTLHTEHIKELESLLLRIVSPEGNMQSGKFMDSENLFRDVQRQIKDNDADRRAILLGGTAQKRRRRAKSRKNKNAGTLMLAGLVERAIPLRGWSADWEYKARLLKNGQISYEGSRYDNPTAAAKATGRQRINGWKFWYYKNPRGEWAPISDLRK